MYDRKKIGIGDAHVDVMSSVGMDGVRRLWVYGEDGFWPYIWQQRMPIQRSDWAQKVVNACKKIGFYDDQARMIAANHCSNAYYVGPRFYIKPAYIAQRAAELGIDSEGRVKTC